MTTVTTVTVVDLDFIWVDHILTTAFDYAHGSANHWLVRCGVERIGDFRGINPWEDTEGLWWTIELKGSTSNVVVGGSMLNAACGELVNSNAWDVDAQADLLRALETPNQPPHLDGHTCDVIVQLALYGHIAYSNIT